MSMALTQGHETATALQQADTMARHVPRPTLVRVPSLLYWRLQRGYAQPELARRAGTTRVTVGRLENGGETRPTMVRKLAEALGLEPGDLMRQPPTA
jgi:DNA-binding XRE family transcriptional regulator